MALHALVAMRHDGAILLSALRALRPHQVLHLLHYLHTWLQRHGSKFSVSHAVPLPAEKIDTECKGTTRWFP